tara:strand:- start:1284 stop:1856 length:573 start_codon:yes stop_codon:yes gene_type:complete
MTRKINVDLTHSIGTFMSKVNQFSDFIGDLDNLDSSFANAHADSNIVSALNHVGTLIDSLNDHLFGDSPGVLRVSGLITDSASFKRIRVGTMEVDSATIDSATIRNLDVDQLTVDSAIINRLTVGEAIIDSAVIDSATITHAYITNFNMNDQGGSNVELDNLKLFTVKNESGTIVMSGHFLSTSDDITIP